MKNLNFAKVKKSVGNFIKSIAFWNKKKYADNQNVGKEFEQNVGHSNYRKGGYKHYSHIIVPINNNKPSIYTSFRKQKLPGSIYIFKKTIYRITQNPEFVG